MPAKRELERKQRPDYIKWLLIMGTVALAIVLVVVYVNRHRIWHANVVIDSSRYPVKGIDVSKHNGDINFDKVALQGYRFVFVKASEGATYRDPNFERNVAAARKAGLLVGAYHFFRKNRDGFIQANNFINACAHVKLDLPMVIDIEDWGNDTFVDEELVQTRVREMGQTLSARRHKFMIYTNGNGYDKYYKPNFGHVPLWLCSFNKPQEIRQFGHTFQQYSHWGSVEGIDGEVDLDVFCGSMDDWHRFVNNYTVKK